MKRKAKIAIVASFGATIVAVTMRSTPPEIEFPSFPSSGGVVGRDVDQAGGLRLTGDLAWTTYRIEEPWTSAYPRVQRDLVAQGFRTVSETPSGSRWFRASDHRGAYVMKQVGASEPMLNDLRVGREATPGESIGSRFTRFVRGR